MISLKTLAKSIREAKLTAPRKGKSTPLDATIQIPGYGVMTRKNLQKAIARYLAEVSKYARSGNPTSAYSVLYKSSVLKVFLETEIKHSGE